jgi:hypothetical protein
MVVPIDYFSVDFLAFEVTFVPQIPTSFRRASSSGKR